MHGLKYSTITHRANGRIFKRKVYSLFFFLDFRVQTLKFVRLRTYIFKYLLEIKFQKNKFLKRI